MRTLVFLALVGCGDRSLSFINTDPNVVILSPTDGEGLVEDTPVVLRASVDDAETALEDIALEWSTDRGVLVGEPGVDDGDVTLAVPGFPSGPLTLTLTAIDDDGASTTDSVDITVDINNAPQLTFTEPGDNAQLVFGNPVTVGISVSDDRDEAEDLTLQWSLGDGPVSPNPDGSANVVLSGLPIGAQDIRVTVTDTLGAETQATLGLFVTDGDVDEDGFTSTALGGTDCDDGNPDVFPGAEERCNDIDDNCNNTTDESNPTAPQWYLDDDDDDFGAGPAVRACTRPANHVADNTDCDDTRRAVNPDAIEICNDLDDDCDTVTDTDATDRRAFYADADSDGYGFGAATLACDEPANSVTNNSDCNDGDRLIHPFIDADDDGSNACLDCDDNDPNRTPGATEQCDGVDNDCSGSIPADETQNSDGDAYVACADCDDGDPAVFPGATELCNAIDDNCDGDADETGCPCPVFATDDGVPYQFCEGSLNWGQAVDACGDDYAPVSIESATENTFLRQVIQTYPWSTPPSGQSADDAWWTGGFRDTGSGGAFCASDASPWEWLSDGSFAYTNWRATEPNNLTGCEGCVEIWLDDATGQPRAEWNDEDCGARRNYICEPQ